MAIPFEYLSPDRSIKSLPMDTITTNHSLTSVRNERTFGTAPAVGGNNNAYVYDKIYCQSVHSRRMWLKTLLDE